jgi:hypothetical protein
MPDDIKDILESGKFGFDPTDSKILNNLQSKYSRDYFPFIKSVVEKSDGKDEKLNSLLSLIQDVIRNLGKLLSGRITGDTGHKLLTKVFDDIKLTEEGFAYVKSFISKESEVAKALKETEEKVGVSFDDLVSKHKEVRKYVEAIEPKKTSLLENVAKTAFGGGAGVAGGVGLSLAHGLLGPFSQLAMTGIGAGGGVFKAIRGLRGAQKERHATRVSEMLLGEGKNIPQAVFPRTTPQPVNVPANIPIQPSSVGSGKLRGQALAQAADPIFYFFDKAAYKASWTSKVLDLLKKTSSIEGKTGRGFLGGLGMGSIMSFIGPMLAMIAPLVMGFLANKLTSGLRERGSKITKGIDVFRNFVPGLSLMNPLKGPKQTAEAYSDLTKKVTSSISIKLDKMYGGKDEVLSGISTKLKSMTDSLAPLKKSLGEGFAGLTGGISNVFPKKVEAGLITKVFPSFDKETIKETIKTKELERQTVEIKEKSSFTLSNLLDKINKELITLNKKIDKQTETLKPSRRSFSVPETSDVHYGNKDVLLDGLNSGRIRP